jgi:hypothetical protein
LELLELPELPASCNPPLSPGFALEEAPGFAPEDEPEEDDEGCGVSGCVPASPPASPGYGNCLFGWSAAPPCCCFCGSGAGVASPGYGNCCAAFDGTGWSSAGGQFELVVVFPSPRVTVPEQFIGVVGSPVVLPSGACLYGSVWPGGVWPGGVCPIAPAAHIPASATTGNHTRVTRCIYSLDDNAPSAYT